MTSEALGINTNLLSRGKPLILVVEPDRDNRDIALAILTFQGYEALTATNGVAALQATAAQRPDLILLEVMLPQLSGLDLIRQLRSRAVRIPIIAVTAMPQTPYQEQTLAAGATEFLQKPYYPEELLQRVTRYLPQRS